MFTGILLTRYPVHENDCVYIIRVLHPRIFLVGMYIMKMHYIFVHPRTLSPFHPFLTTPGTHIDSSSFQRNRFQRAA